MRLTRHAFASSNKRPPVGVGGGVLAIDEAAATGDVGSVANSFCSLAIMRRCQIPFSERNRMRCGGKRLECTSLSLLSSALSRPTT